MIRGVGCRCGHWQLVNNLIRGAWCVRLSVVSTHARDKRYACTCTPISTCRDQAGAYLCGVCSLIVCLCHISPVHLMVIKTINTTLGASQTTTPNPRPSPPSFRSSFRSSHGHFTSRGGRALIKSSSVRHAHVATSKACT